MIYPAFVPGMTADDSSESEPDAPPDAEAIDGLIGILAAARIEPTPALTKNFPEDTMIGRERFLVETDEYEKGMFEHGRILYLVLCILYT